MASQVLDEFALLRREEELAMLPPGVVDAGVGEHFRRQCPVPVDALIKFVVSENRGKADSPCVYRLSLEDGFVFYVKVVGRMWEFFTAEDAADLGLERELFLLDAKAAMDE